MRPQTQGHRKPRLRPKAHLVMEACIERGLAFGIAHALETFDLIDSKLREELQGVLIHACERELTNAFYEDFEWPDV